MDTIEKQEILLNFENEIMRWSEGRHPENLTSIMSRFYDVVFTVGHES